MAITSFKADIVFTSSADNFDIWENSYLNVEGDEILSVGDKPLGKIVDYSGNLIIPGFVDTHTHAPQINNMGLGYDRQLLQWLEKYTFPEEAKYEDAQYAEKSYKRFVEKLADNGITSSVIFGSIYKDTTISLAQMLEKKGLRAYIGKVNMDRNSPKFYREETAKSLENTMDYIEKLSDFKNVKPIITPRFVPSCTDKLMEGLGKLAQKYDLKIQSHLSENKEEIDWVKSLHKDCKSYYDVYEKYGLIREDVNTVMAHCVWLTEEEKKKMIDNKIMVSHCPHSNGNVASGIAPISDMLSMGFKIGLGSDISGGNEMFMGRIISLAAMFSKMYFVHIDKNSKPLSTSQLFYMATKGGGEFFDSFGKVGSFEKGYKADFLVVKDDNLSDANMRTVEERLERFLYTGERTNIEKVYINGKIIE